MLTARDVICAVSCVNLVHSVRLGVATVVV